MSKIMVTAGEGRLVPIPKSFATAPGGLQLYLTSGVKPRDAQPSQLVEKIELPAGDSYVIRALDNGDLVRFVDTAKKKEI